MQTPEKYNVICLSNQLWLEDFWTNKSHVMSRLSKLGHKVLFVEPPINTGSVFAREILKGSWSIKRLFTQQRLEPKSGVHIYSPLNTLPNTKVTARWHVSRINKINRRLFDKSQKTILWIYHVQMKELEMYLDGLSYDLLIYDCVDNYAGFPENSSFYSTTVNKKQLLTQETNLTKRADLVFASAPGLMDRLKYLNPKTYFTPNVGDYAKFSATFDIVELPEDIRTIPQPRIGFTGALDEYKFDLNLFKQLAEEHQDKSFVLIGSLAIKSKETNLRSLGLDSMKNVYFLGSRPYEHIQKYFAGFDTYIIPYQLNDYTVGGCFPVKFHDALAAGLPVVVTDLPAYAPFAQVCYISKTYDDFSSNINRALLENSAQKEAERKLIAKENNWDGKVNRMLEYISSETKL